MKAVVPLQTVLFSLWLRAPDGCHNLCDFHEAFLYIAKFETCTKSFKKRWNSLNFIVCLEFSRLAFVSQIPMFYSAASFAECGFELEFDANFV